MPILNRIALSSERTVALHARAAQALRNSVAARRRQLSSAEMLLSTLSYQSVLQRGFALVRDASGRPVRTAMATSAGERLELEFGDGRVDAQVLGVRASGAGKPGAAVEVSSTSQSSAGVRRPKGRGGGGQGSLF